jgi:3' terminal RNA ribose 2'-O-methyltransferase Hen1
MLLTLTSTTAPATDLGWLLGKHPDRVQSFELAFGTAHVFFPEAHGGKCTAALLLEVDPVGLVRRPRGESLAVDAYTNDRPYAASSFLAVAIGRVFRSAIAGRCKEKPELAERALPLEAHVPALPARGGEKLVRDLFEPLGYELEVEAAPPERGQGDLDLGPIPHVHLTLRGTVSLSALLRHLAVLIPVLDDAKHDFVDASEVEKLLERGEGWLEAHPRKELIAARYLEHRRGLVRVALARLTDDEAPGEADRSPLEETLERPLTLNQQRLRSVQENLRSLGARSVLDLGCGEGKLLQALAQDRELERVVGVEVSTAVRDRAAARLRLDKRPERARPTVELVAGSVVYRDAGFAGFDAACLIEVIEHLDPSRLDTLEAVVFGEARPGAVLVTTPNREHNVRFPSLLPGQLRHHDHRFEWTRGQFQGWARGVAERRGYQVRFSPIGPDDPEVGPPTQMAVFEQRTPEERSEP